MLLIQTFVYNLVNNKQEKGNYSICHFIMWTNASTGLHTHTKITKK